MTAVERLAARDRILDALRRADEGRYPAAWYFYVDRRDVEAVLMRPVSDDDDMPSRAAFDVDDEAPVTLPPERVSVIAQEADVRYPEAVSVLRAAGFRVGLIAKQGCCGDPGDCDGCRS